MKRGRRRGRSRACWATPTRRSSRPTCAANPAPRSSTPGPGIQLDPTFVKLDRLVRQRVGLREQAPRPGGHHDQGARASAARPVDRSRTRRYLAGLMGPRRLAFVCFGSSAWRGHPPRRASARTFPTATSGTSATSIRRRRPGRRPRRRSGAAARAGEIPGAARHVAQEMLAALQPCSSWIRELPA